MTLAVLWTGSREFPPDIQEIAEELVWTVMDTFPDGTRIIVGGAKFGVDLWVEEAGKAFGLDVQVRPAKWKRYGRRAGFVRNEEMVEELMDWDGPKRVIAVWNGSSHGTRHTFELAESYKLDTLVMEPS